jgi:tetratricopeptide (TPR) repeat protein
MLGSGVALARNLLITNCHVVQSGSALIVSRGKEHWPGRLVQAAPDHDLCGIRPSGLTLQPVEVRLSSKLATGERVYAIGSPEGLELTFSEGVISALRDSEGVRLIQTSAPTSPGSSGGGLFDAQGNLVGITTFQFKEGQSLNFALPGEWAKALVDASAEASRTSSSPRNDTELESTAWLRIGQGAEKSENYDLAVRSFQKSADLKQGDAFQGWFELGEIWVKGWNVLSTVSHSLDAYKHWLCSTVSDGRACEEYLSGGVLSGDWKEGLKSIDSSKQKALETAMADFENSIELKPDYADAWNELSRVHFIRKEYVQAVSAETEATRLAPSEYRYWQYLGWGYVKTKSYSKAIEALRQAEKLAPNDMKSSELEFLGDAYAKTGDREQVMRIYQELKAMDPEGAKGFFRDYILPESTGTRPDKVSH